MNKTTTYGLLLTLGLAASLAGCKKKDEETVTPAPTKTDLLTNKNWLISDVSVTVGTTTQSIYSQIPACNRDDFSRFETPNVFKDDAGATKCSSSDPQTVTGTWAFNTDQTKLTITESGSSDTYDIVTLTDASLSLKETITSQGTTYVYTITFKK